MNKLKTLAVVFCIIFSSSTFAQLGTSSPYSRFGLGGLQKNVFPMLEIRKKKIQTKENYILGMAPQ